MKNPLLRFVLLQDNKDVEIYKNLQNKNDVVVVFSLEACIRCNELEIAFNWIDEIINLNGIKRFFLDINNVDINLNKYYNSEELFSASIDFIHFYRKYCVIKKTVHTLVRYILSKKGYVFFPKANFDKYLDCIFYEIFRLCAKEKKIKIINENSNTSILFLVNGIIYSIRYGGFVLKNCFTNNNVDNNAYEYNRYEYIFNGWGVGGLDRFINIKNINKNISNALHIFIPKIKTDKSIENYQKYSNDSKGSKVIHLNETLNFPSPGYFFCRYLILFSKIISILFNDHSKRKFRLIELVSFSKEITIALCRAIVYNYSFKILFLKIQPKCYVGVDDGITDGRSAFIQAKILGIKTYSFPHGINFYDEIKYYGKIFFLGDKVVSEKNNNINYKERGRFYQKSPIIKQCFNEQDMKNNVEVVVVLSLINHWSYESSHKYFWEQIPVLFVNILKKIKLSRIIIKLHPHFDEKDLLENLGCLKAEKIEFNNEHWDSNHWKEYSMAIFYNCISTSLFEAHKASIPVVQIHSDQISEYWQYSVNSWVLGENFSLDDSINKIREILYNKNKRTEHMQLTNSAIDKIIYQEKH